MQWFISAFSAFAAPSIKSALVLFDPRITSACHPTSFDNNNPKHVISAKRRQGLIFWYNHRFILWDPRQYLFFRYNHRPILWDNCRFELVCFLDRSSYGNQKTFLWNRIFLLFHRFVNSIRDEHIDYSNHSPFFSTASSFIDFRFFCWYCCIHLLFYKGTLIFTL